MPVKAGVIRAGARTTKRGAAETFTGVVFQDPVINAESPSRLGGSVVTFTPGARTAWHSHPVGQILGCVIRLSRFVGLCVCELTFDPVAVPSALIQ